MMVRRSKYGNRKTASNGLIFDSKLEAGRWSQLLLLERAGEISDLQRQIPIPLTVNGKTVCKLVIDFQYWDEKRQQTVWEDAKGMITPIASLKLKLARACYPDMHIEVWRGD